jgi:hypothetical protein
VHPPDRRERGATDTAVGPLLLAQPADEAPSQFGVARGRLTECGPGEQPLPGLVTGEVAGDPVDRACSCRCHLQARGALRSA